MRIANCKWFVGSRTRWLHFKCCPIQLPGPYGSRVWQHGVSCLTFFSYMKNNFHLILLPAAENEWKKCFILKFVLVFSISTPTLGQWQGKGAGEGATSVAAVSLGCPWAGAGLWAKREGGRKGNLLGRVVSVSFCSMCVQIFMSIAFVLLLLLLMLVGTICQSPLLLCTSYSCCSPCHSHSFKHFMIFYLFSFCCSLFSFLHAFCSWKFGKLRLIALFSATPTTSCRPLCVLLLFVIVVCLCHASLSHCPPLAWLIFSIAMQKLFLCTVENF